MNNQRIFRARAFFLVSTLLLTQVAIAEERLLECDQTVTVKITAEGQDKNAWVTFHKNEWKLTAIGFSGNEPSKLEDLKPYDIKARKTEKIETWIFEGDYPDGKWISCDYQKGALVRSKRIDDNAKSCSVTYRKVDQGYLVDHRVSCVF